MEVVIFYGDIQSWLSSRISFLLFVMVLLGTGGFVHRTDRKVPAMDDSGSISKTLETIRTKHHFPALAIAVAVDGKIIATNAVSFRKQGGKEKVTANDQFHIGSVTKSMTATVAAMLVEQKKISWKTTIQLLEKFLPTLKKKLIRNITASL